eukprot:8846983-Karenia_brevis.AAC.1
MAKAQSKTPPGGVASASAGGHLGEVVAKAKPRFRGSAAERERMAERRRNAEAQVAARRQQEEARRLQEEEEKAQRDRDAYRQQQERNANML